MQHLEKLWCACDAGWYKEMWYERQAKQNKGETTK